MAYEEFRSQESGVRIQESEYWSQNTGVRIQESGVRSRNSRVGFQEFDRLTKLSIIYDQSCRSGGLV